MVNLTEHFNLIRSLKQDEFSFISQEVTLSDGTTLKNINHMSGALFVEKLVPNFKLSVDEETKTLFNVVPKEALEYLSPDLIDSKEFWKKSTEIFPYLSVYGSINQLPENPIKEFNQGSLYYQDKLGALRWFIKKINTDSIVLEIGPGFGPIYNWLKKSDENLANNYYSIDVNPLFWHDNMYFCDGQTIPDAIPNNIDIVYSINVFQHLSKAQRESYYNQIYKKLTPGGTFIVGAFCVTKNNFNKRFWSHRDEDGNAYSVFMGQYTLVEHLDEWIENLKKHGFKIIQGLETDNYVCLELIKSD